MKPISEQNFYELLEISSGASPEEIVQAYEIAKLTYGENSLAVHPLFSQEERRDIMRRIYLAHETLSEVKRRRCYDRDLGLLKDLRPSAVFTKKMEVDNQIPFEESEGGLAYREKPPTGTLNGARLKEYRESIKIPLQEIANKTRINITYFESLEKEKYEALPAPVYLRGYIKQYAGILGLDPDAVADRIIDLVKKTSMGERQNKLPKFN